jgi:tetratricopeptide (TPR) repeat protein
VKGVFTDISPICEALKQTAQECEQNSVPISLMTADDDVSKKKLDQLDSSFMYTQILKEILLTIKFGKKDRAEFVDYFREQFDENDPVLQKIIKFEEKYHDKTPIYWYTSESFLYPMLNRVLRTMDAGMIIKLGFFTKDLHRHIQQLHKEQFSGQNTDNSFTVYRGQGMLKKDFKHMKRIKGGLLSFNCFLSTSKDRKVSLCFAESISQSNPDLVGIHFVITIDSSQSTTPFASIIDVGHYGAQEDEVLFSMHTVFRIGDITSMDENNRLFRVELTLTSDNDKDLRRLTDRIREETFPESPGWYRLALVLLKMGHPEKAQEMCETLLKQETEEGAKAAIYNQLGQVKASLGEYHEAIAFYKKSLEIDEKILPSNHPYLGSSYGDIGNVYREIGDYQKALAIQQQSLPPNHPELASSYNNIGNVYDDMGEYPKALSSYEKALAIRQQSLPPNHPQLANSYNNIGNVYQEIGNYSKALSPYEEALAIRQQSLPPNHPDLASSYDNIGNVYENMGDYQGGTN